MKNLKRSTKRPHTGRRITRTRNHRARRNLARLELAAKMAAIFAGWQEMAGHLMVLFSSIAG